MWSPFKGNKSSSSTAVSALNVALTTSAGRVPTLLPRHSTVSVEEPPQLELRFSTHTRRNTSDATASSVCSPSTGQDESTAPTSPKREPTRASTVVVLLDGDHDYFKKGLLEQGHRGGKKAAIELHQRLESFVQEQEGEGASRPDILMMLFWNKAGLSQHLASENGGRPYDLSGFASGFSNSPFAAVAVDTGFSPQSADEAIKAHLRIHIKMADYLFLGGSHDGGYASALHQLEDTAYLRKIILLRTSTSCTSWLADLQLAEARFEGLFNGGEGVSDSKYLWARVGAAPMSPQAQSAPVVPRSVASSWSPTMHLRQLQPALAPAVPSHVAPVAPAPPSRTSSAVQGPPPASSAVQGFTTLQLNVPAVPEKFKPLVTLLEKERDSGWRRSSKDHLWGHLRKTLRPLEYGAFGPYLQEAENVGIVDLHEAETGRVWVNLLLPGPNESPTVRKSIPEPFAPLVAILRQSRSSGRPQVLCGYLGERLGPLRVYERAGVSRFGEYIRKAEELGLVRQGGPAGGAEWVALI